MLQQQVQQQQVQQQQVQQQQQAQARPAHSESVPRVHCNCVTPGGSNPIGHLPISISKPSKIAGPATADGMAARQAGLDTINYPFAVQAATDHISNSNTIGCRRKPGQLTRKVFLGYTVTVLPQEAVTLGHLPISTSKPS